MMRKITEHLKLGVFEKRPTLPTLPSVVSRLGNNKKNRNMKSSNKMTAKQEETLSTLLKMKVKKVIADSKTSVLENSELLNIAKTDFEKKRELSEILANEVHQQLKEKACSDIKSIVKMFTHIGRSMKEYSMDIPQLRHFGFPAGTLHLEEYQKQKMTAQERRDQPWRYTDKNSKSLYKQLAMCEYYYANVNHSDMSISIPKEHLMELVSISSKYEKE